MRTAIVHDLLTTKGGADQTLQSLLRAFPSPVYTLVADLKAVKASVFRDVIVVSSFIQKLPFSRTKYRSYLPLYPLAIEQFDLRDYDIVLSSSFIVSKGAVTHTDQLHICYMHNPIRPAWELYQQFMSHQRNGRGLKGLLSRVILHYLRLWDVISANRADYLIANSHFTAQRIKKIYDKQSTVIYPPVDTDDFPLETSKDDFYVTTSRLVYHKRVDIIIKAFAAMPQKKLYVIGEGPEYKALKKMAPANVELLGYLPNDLLIKYLQKAKAFIFAACEDFGIAPIEAMACGTPVLAFGKGGAREAIVQKKTGLLFNEQNPSAIQGCVEDFERLSGSFDPATISRHAEQFSRARFEREYKVFVDAKAKAFFARQKFSDVI